MQPTSRAISRPEGASAAPADTRAFVAWCRRRGLSDRQIRAALVWRDLPAEIRELRDRGLLKLRLGLDGELRAELTPDGMSRGRSAAGGDRAAQVPIGEQPAGVEAGR